MEKPIRTFIAIKIHPGNRFNHVYSVLQANLKHETIRWIPKNDFHITLRFLGETSPSQLKKIKTELENIAGRFTAFQFNLKGFGIIKRKGKPSVLFAKTENSPMLNQLAEEIEISMQKSGFHEKIKAFKPHLTLGRIKQLEDKNKFISLVQKSEETDLQRIKVSEIIFYQNTLHSDGPKYNPIATFQLNKL